MACGVPTVVSSAGALPEIVGQAGIVHGVGDEAELAQQLLRVLLTPELRRSLSAAAHVRAVQRFSWQAMCDGYFELYRSLINIRSQAPIDQVL
jgi:glycosyltransferase involved in cell wall biosynthesis